MQTNNRATRATQSPAGIAPSIIGFLLSLTTLLVAALPITALSLHASASPDLSSRIVVPWAHENPPQSIASGAAWAAMGAGSISLLGSAYTDWELLSYPVTVTGPWNGSAFLDLEIDPPDLGPGTAELFGAALSLQGFRLAVGVPEEISGGVQCSTACFCCGVVTDTSAGGKVRLYLFDGAGFQPERTITFGNLHDRFGDALALGRFHLLVGSPGAEPGSAHLFDPDTGTLIESFSSPDATGNDDYGSAVAITDDLALVGAPGVDKVYVYRDDGSGNWSAAGTLTSPGAGSRFGWAIAAEDERILVGAPGIDRAYIFEDGGDSNWPVVAELAGDADGFFGGSVAVNGDAAWVSAPYRLVGAEEVGLVAQFERTSEGEWPQTGTLVSASPADGDRFGYQISASNRMLTALATGEDTQYVFTAPANVHDDPDGDGITSVIPSFEDNCPNVANADQADFDEDGEGDACDTDDDGDGLSDEDEAIAGSDPFNPDTDGDGLLDGADPFPTDTDGDGDGRDDPDDALPLDPYDGWGFIDRLGCFCEIEQAAIGDGVVLLVDRNVRVPRAYTHQAGGWATVPPPSVNGQPVPNAYKPSMRGNRAVVIDTGTGGAVAEDVVHAFEWSESSGWTLLGTVDPFAGVNTDEGEIHSAAIDGNLLALHVTIANWTQVRIFELTSQGFSRVAVRNVGFSGGHLVVAGETVFFGEPGAFLNAGQVRIYEAGDGFIEQSVTPSPPEDYARFGDDLSVAGDNRIVVNSSGGSFLLGKEGTWTLTPTGAGESFSGGGGQVIAHRNSASGDFTVERSDNGEVIGILQNISTAIPNNNIHWSTNGRVIVYVSAFQIEFYPIDLDEDNVADDIDNCPDDYNPAQLDSDGDGVGDVCDQPVGC